MSYRDLIFFNIRPIWLIFIYSHFPEFLPIILSVLLRYVESVNNSVVDFIFKDKKVLLTIVIQFFGKKFG